MKKFGKTFEKIFGTSKDAVFSGNPTSLILLGDHTHYNDGILIPITTDRHVKTGMALNSDTSLNIHINDREYTYDVLSIGIKAVPENWMLRCIANSFSILREKFGIKEGANLLVEINVPPAIGQGVQAALILGIFKLANKLYKLKLSEKNIVKFGRQAELEVSGKISNLAHFYAINAAKSNIMKVDLRSERISNLGEDLSDYDLVICDTKIQIVNPQEICNERIEECAVGVQGLRLYIWGIRNLRDVKKDFLERHIHMLPRRIYNRCLYNILERDRVKAATKALREGSIAELGKIMFSSHQDLSLIYDISCPEVDYLVELSKELDYVIGSKMISCSPIRSTINILKKGTAERYKTYIQREYKKKYGGEPIIHELKSSESTKITTLRQMDEAVKV